MQFNIISLFPEMIAEMMQYGINRRAFDNGLVQMDYWNPRDFSDNAYKSVDDRPYGGGPGMVMSAEPLLKVLQDIAQKKQKKVQKNQAKVIYLSPQGTRLTHDKVVELSQMAEITLICGRYEGIDERVLQITEAEQISIGDYVLSGGELPAGVLIDAIIRQLPGSLGNESSAAQDSFADGLLDCPHYTRPEKLEVKQDGETKVYEVPAVLTGGNHAHIAKWRLKQSLGKTWLTRKDLLAAYTLDKASEQLLQEFIAEFENADKNHLQQTGEKEK